MPSFTAISAAAILAFSGMASAIPQYNFANGTSSAGPTGSGRPTSSSMRPMGTAGAGAASGSNSTVPAIDGKFCPGLDLDLYIDNSGFTFQIQCDTTHFGTIIDIQVNLTRRAVPSSLDDCMNLCDATTSCVGTAFDTNARSCTLFSDVQAAYTQQGTQFAQRVASGSGNGAGNGAAGNGAAGNGAAGNGEVTISAGGVATSTIYSTNVVTIHSCAPTVTNCPLKNGAAATITQLIAVSSTEYICPTATVIPAAPIACTDCPYSASTATVFSATGGSLVPVATTVYACPSATGTALTTTICTACAKPTANMNNGNGASTQTVTVCNGQNCPAMTSAPASSSSIMAVYTPTQSSQMAVYTGAASNVKAAGALAAVFGAAALVL